MYCTHVIKAVDDLVRNRFLICDDTQDIVTRLLQAGLAAGVPPPNPNQNASTPDPVPSCHGRMPPRYNYHYVYEQNPG